MFLEAIKKISEFTRPIHIITRKYNSDFVGPGAATMFFVNELGVAITCKHVAEILAQSESVNTKYSLFKKEKESLPGPSNKKYKRMLKELEQKYGCRRDIVVEIKNMFVNCVDKLDNFEIIAHPIYDLAIIKINGHEKLSYKNYAIFIKDENNIQQGKYLCRLGYPFPEFSNYKYDLEKDEINWTSEGRLDTPSFPIDGIITRLIGDQAAVVGIELSTPGLKGQSGGPLFDRDGKIYGMQSTTHHLHLGFDMKNFDYFDYKEGGISVKVNNQPFLHVGQCIHANIIKSFLKEKNIKFYEE